MNFVQVFLLTVLLAVATSASATNLITPEQIQAEIKVEGAKAIVLKYYDTPAWQMAIAPGMRSARANWLSVAEKLYVGADGAAAEDIDLALYDALAVAPFRVLPILSRMHRRDIKVLCDVSYEAEFPHEGIVTYLGKIRHELDRAQDRVEKNIASQCKVGLDKSLKSANAHG